MPQNLKSPAAQHRQIKPTELTMKTTRLRHGMCRTSHKESPDAQVFLILYVFLNDLFLSRTDDAFVSTVVCCFYGRACRLRRPSLKPVQYVVKFCKHKKHNENLVRNNTPNKKMKIPFFHQRIQEMSIFLPTKSLAKRNKLVSICTNDSTDRVSYELI